MQTIRLIGVQLAGLFSVSPMIVALVIAILLWVVEFGLFMELPLVVFLFIYIFWLTPNYFFEIIEFKALGNAGWPVFSLETFVSRRSQVGLVFSVLVLLFAAAYLALRYAGLEDSAKLLLGAGLVLLPASMALLAVTREFVSALNPLKVLATVLAMGIGYLVCIADALAILMLLGLAQERGGLHFYLLLCYTLFLQAYLIGSIVYARRRELGVNAVRSPEAVAERAQATVNAIRSSVLSHAYGFAARGNKGGALSHIESYIAKEDDSLEARLWMFNEISRWEDKAVALSFGKSVIDFCERHAHDDDAARVRLSCEHLDMPTR